LAAYKIDAAVELDQHHGEVVEPFSEVDVVYASDPQNEDNLVE